MKTMRLYTGRSGFTLIELLIVVAIIGILSAVILLALDQTRRDARQARVVASLQNVQAVAHSLMDNNGSFGDPQEVDAPCEYGVFNDSQVQEFIEDLENQTGGSVSCAIGPGGLTFAFSIDSSDFTGLCVQQDRLVYDAVADGGDGDVAYCLEN